MSMAEWAYLTNHARVLLHLAHDSGARLRDIAASLGITERRAHGIITDLAEAGYVITQKDGRRNRYQIQAHLPVPEPGTREPAVGEAVALFEPIPGEAELVSGGILPRSNEDLLAEWLTRTGAMLEDASLDFVLQRFEPVGEMVPTGSGEMPRQADEFATPDVIRRDGRWVHEGAFAGAGGRHGRHSPDFLPLWEEMTMLYRAHPGAKW